MGSYQTNTHQGAPLGNDRVRAGRFRSFVSVWVAAFGFIVTLAGCGAGNVQVTATGGVGGQVGDIVIRNAQFTFAGPVAGDTVYEPGDNASLKLSIVNEGDRIDRLVRITSPIARSATITGDATIPGHQVFTAGYQAPIASTALPGTHEVRIILIGLRVPIRAGLTYPVVFAFEHAGELGLELPVENPNIPRFPTPAYALMHLVTEGMPGSNTPWWLQGGALLALLGQPGDEPAHLPTPAGRQP